MARLHHEPPSPHDVGEALNYLDNSDRDLWVQMAMAVKAGLGDSGFEVWLTWSKGHDSFKQRDAEAVWRSVKSSGGVSIASLFFLAQRNGYRSQAQPNANRQAAYHSGEYQAVLKHRRQRQQQQTEQQKKAKQRRQARAAMRYARFFKSLPPALNHPYLQKKRIAGYGARVYRSHKRQVVVIPMLDQCGRFLSCQIIGNRERRFLKCASAKGGFFKLHGRPERLIVCEGYATGASLHAATRYSVAVSFSDHNLGVVAAQLAYQQPQSQLIIAGDDDWHNSKNPGKQAMQAALNQLPEAVGCLPQFPNGIERCKQTTDFNDLQRVTSLAEVHRQIRRAVLRQKTRA